MKLSNPARKILVISTFNLCGTVVKTIYCKICKKKADCYSEGEEMPIYYWCINCGYISIEEDKIISREEEKERYLKHENTIDNKGYVNMFEEFIQKTITPYSKGRNTVLDFGCGSGAVLAALLRGKGYGVDIYDIYFAPEKVYKNKNYDIITATEVLEHIKNPLSILKLLKNHLTKKGIIALMTLFHPDDRMKFKKWWYRKDPTHISFYDPKTFQYIADILNMRILMINDKNLCVLENIYE